MTQSDNTNCPECGKAIEEPTAYCTHCSTDLRDEFGPEDGTETGADLGDDSEWEAGPDDDQGTGPAEYQSRGGSILPPSQDSAPSETGDATGDTTTRDDGATTNDSPTTTHDSTTTDDSQTTTSSNTTSDSTPTDSHATTDTPTVEGETAGTANTQAGTGTPAGVGDTDSSKSVSVDDSVASGATDTGDTGGLTRIRVRVGQVSSDAVDLLSNLDRHVHDGPAAVTGVILGTFTGTLMLFIALAVTGNSLSWGIGFVAWVATTVRLARKRSVSDALAGGAYATSLVFLSTPFLPLVPVLYSGTPGSRIGSFLFLSLVVVFPGLVAAAVGYGLSRFVPE